MFNIKTNKKLSEIFDNATLKDIAKPSTTSVIGSLLGAGLFSLPDIMRYKGTFTDAKYSGKKVDPEEIKNRKKAILLKALGGALAGYGATTLWNAAGKAYKKFGPYEDSVEALKNYMINKADRI